MTRSKWFYSLLCCLAVGCGDDDDSNASEAVRRGVGAACATSEDCTEPNQVCLTEFKGGMCGVVDCTASSDCPAGSVCVEMADLGHNYCLLICQDKPDCNLSRPAADEANCSSTLDPIDPPDGGAEAKVCAPPSA
jgi:hypothetical protein